MEPHTRSYEEPSEYWGAQVSETFVVEMCPRCGSEEIEEVNECVICGHATGSVFKEFCLDCHDDLSKKLKYLQLYFRLDYDTLKDMIAEHFEWR